MEVPDVVQQCWRFAGVVEMVDVRTPRQKFWPSSWLVPICNAAVAHHRLEPWC
ncbi:MAG: hypothetical protein R2755_13735 [Acidimicrobiales bacterium]